MTVRDGFDVVVVGAGVIGLAHAWTARQRGLSVAVVDRDHRCVGASIRNFGFITVTGQRAGDTWRRAYHSRDIWAQIAPQAGIPIEHRGLWVLARHHLSMPVLEAFVQTEMGRQCSLHDAADTAQRAPWLNTEGAAGALYSPHELRMESRRAIPQLAAWLAQDQGVHFFRGEEVLAASTGRVVTAARELRAGHIVLCPGTELQGVARPHLQDLGLRLTRLQMLRVQPQPGLRLGSAVMSDLGLVRYTGYADLPAAAALRRHLEVIEGDSLAHGIHLIAVQSADGSLVVGDSHHDDPTPEPFASEHVDDLILRHLSDALDVRQARVVERWTGVYPTGARTDCVLRRPEPGLHVVVVTSGTGASTAFGIADDTFKEL